MKSWKEEKSLENSQGAKTLHEAYNDYDDGNYIKAYKYARRALKAPLRDLYAECCGPEGKYHLGIGSFEEMAMEAFTDALEGFLGSLDR